MTQSNMYFDLVRNTIRMIEDWFSGADNRDELYKELMAVFAADFTMITMGGTELGYPEISAFFKAQAGAKSGLKIKLENMSIIYENSDGALVTYHEIQEDLCHGPRKRLATAYLTKIDTRLQWNHLHETSVAQI
ncbi:nuclear transport factor 2 family protein [Ochrobactrum quorumnocens]|nr:nuclear transport factor 2 family protein [[Ochrobactrum] quorumnocens]